MIKGKKNTKKPAHGSKTSCFFCKNGDISMPMWGFCRRFFYGTGFLPYSAGVGQGTYVGLQYPWYPPLGIKFAQGFAYRRFYNAR